MYQILDLLKCNNIFCIKNELEEGCTKYNCIKRNTSINYLNPYIIFKEDDISNGESIETKFNNLLINELTTCNKCGYNELGKY